MRLQVFVELEAALAPGGAAAGAAPHFPVEVRFVAADTAWMSPAHGTPGAVFVYIGIIMYRPYGVDPPMWREYFEAFDTICARAGGRPHWAKEFSLAGDVGFRERYPRWDDFKKLRARLDPTCIFVNPWLQRTLGL